MDFCIFQPSNSHQLRTVYDTIISNIFKKLGGHVNRVHGTIIEAKVPLQEMVNSQSMDQAGGVEGKVGAFTPPLATEMSLRTDGYILIGDTPSGKIDRFTDDEIFDLVEKADK